MGGGHISEIAAETPTTATAADSVKLPESTNSIGMEFKLIPAGKFIMGEGDQAHEVTLTKPFKIGVHEVTQAQYEQVMGVNPSKYKGSDNPVEMVSWEDAVEFCRKLSELPAEKEAGNVYRLPTEAEWEYACRAGTTTKYSFGNDESEFGDYAWHHGSGRDSSRFQGSPDRLAQHPEPRSRRCLNTCREPACRKLGQETVECCD